jgi:acyl-CoA reductase-like NAD-dependent aldehyde dehydrogenase
MFVDGEWVESSTGATVASYNPSTGKPWTVIPDASDDDVDRAVRAAAAAMEAPDWQRLTATERGRMVAELGRRLGEHAEDIAELETRENGKLLHENRALLGYVPQYYAYYAGLADKVEGATYAVDKPDMFAYSRREPVGVVAAIVPWNSPSYLTSVKLAPALVCGNAVVIKPSEHASTPLLKLAEIAESVGFPRGIINVVTGRGTGAGASLCAHPGVSRIAFTGGTATARHVVAASAANFARLSLELGGKSPNIVFADADLDNAVSGIIAGTFAANGQSCVAGSRVLVQAAAYDAVAQKLKSRAAELNVGDPTDDATHIGPLALRGQLDGVTERVDGARSSGADVFTGGQSIGELGDGWYFRPTIVEGPSTLDVSRDELFAPVLSLLRFETEDEAIALANGTPYGLAAGIWTQNLARAHRVVARVHCGIAWVNTYRSASPIVPVGGRGQSGYGLEGGREGLESYLADKAVWVNLSEDQMPDPFVMR